MAIRTKKEIPKIAQKEGRERLTAKVIDPTGTRSLFSSPEQVAVKPWFQTTGRKAKRGKSKKGLGDKEGFGDRRSDWKRLREALKNSYVRVNGKKKEIIVTSEHRIINGEKVSSYILKDEDGNRLTERQVDDLVRNLKNIE
ncbi:MAG: hypothetical protein ABID38_06645 [Candidatus Diapherotrites archaeon]